MSDFNDAVQAARKDFLDLSQLTRQQLGKRAQLLHSSQSQASERYQYKEDTLSHQPWKPQRYRSAASRHSKTTATETAPSRFGDRRNAGRKAATGSSSSKNTPAESVVTTPHSTAGSNTYTSRNRRIFHSSGSDSLTTASGSKRLGFLESMYPDIDIADPPKVLQNSTSLSLLNTHQHQQQASRDPLRRNHVKDIFGRTRSLVESLWSEMHISQKERDKFSRDHFHPETRQNMVIIFNEISQLCKLRSIQHRVLMNVELREGYLLRLKEISRRLSFAGKRLLDDQLLRSEIAAIIDSLRVVSVELAETIILWRRETPKKQPFIWNGQNYVLKMQNDLEFLKLTEIASLFDFPLDNNPLLLPTQVRAAMSATGSPAYNRFSFGGGSRAVGSAGMYNNFHLSNVFSPVNANHLPSSALANAQTEEDLLEDVDISLNEAAEQAAFRKGWRMGSALNVVPGQTPPLIGGSDVEDRMRAIISNMDMYGSHSAAMDAIAATTMLNGKDDGSGRLPPLANTTSNKLNFNLASDRERIRRAEKLIFQEEMFLQQLARRDRKIQAAVRIQSAFRGYLARRFCAIRRAKHKRRLELLQMRREAAINNDKMEAFVPRSAVRFA